MKEDGGGKAAWARAKRKRSPNQQQTSGKCCRLCWKVLQLETCENAKHVVSSRGCALEWPFWKAAAKVLVRRRLDLPTCVIRALLASF